jgi:hypothetical protein
VAEDRDALRQHKATAADAMMLRLMLTAERTMIRQGHPTVDHGSVVRRD